MGKQPRLRVCVHERDFQIGVTLVENVVSCIESSRKIVLVLSDAFLQNNWCRFETHVALTQIVEHERNSIILVQLSTLRGQPTSDVNYLIQSRTTLPWHQSSQKQSQFWLRLKQELVVYRDFRLLRRRRVRLNSL